MGPAVITVAKGVTLTLEQINATTWHVLFHAPKALKIRKKK